jgi:hypothetical protein
VYHKGIFAGGICEAELVGECAVEVEKMRNRIQQKQGKIVPGQQR